MGPLRDSTPQRDDPVALRVSLAADGYVLLRRVLPRAEVLATRAEIFGRLEAVDEVRAPAVEGIPTGRSERAARGSDLNAFWRSVSESDTLRHITHGAQLRQLMSDLLDKPADPFDFLWLRAVSSGRASPFHFDHVYMNRGSQRVLTCWIPLGDVPAGDGPILVLEGSHRLDDLIAGYRGHDVDRDPSRAGHVEASPLALARLYDCRLLGTDFKAGDVLIFGMFLLHGSCDNASPRSRIRLSCDVRYQPAADARDPRWFGDPPPGHGGKSYGGLSAAQPITAAPIRR